MQPISNNQPDLFSPLTNINGDPGNLNKIQSSHYALKVQKRTDITLFTQEGDKVTLSSSTSQEAGFATYNQLGFIDGAVSGTSANGFYLSQAFDFELSVEGDLNKQELQDIRKALQTVRKLAHDFFSGRTNHAVKRASKLFELETLSGFEATLQYDLSASLQTASTQVLTPSSSEPLAGARFPQESAVPSGSDSEPEAVTQTTLLGSPISESGLKVAVKQLVERIAELVVRSPVQSEKLSEHTNRFLEHHLAQFSQDKDESRFEFQAIRKIQSELLQKIVDLGEGVETS
jgi:hypothetical protein